MPTLAVLTAAGSGARLGLGRPKALVELDGTPLVVHAARRLAASGVVDVIVVTAPVADVPAVEALLADAALGVPAHVVAGGPTRQASVAAGLGWAAAGDAGHLDESADSADPADPADGVHPDAADVVLVHDAARALAPESLVVRVRDAVRAGHPAVVPGLAVVDTIRQVEPGDDGELQRVTSTLDRTLLRAVQTPQGFERGLLVRAHRAAADRAGDEATAASDDAGLVEALGHGVRVVPGDPAAFKITTIHDLALARLLLEESR